MLKKTSKIRTLPRRLLYKKNTSHLARRTSSLLEKAVFVSGRDAPSISAFSDVLQSGESPMVQPGGVALVRDPVLSDSMFTDAEGKCWKQSEGTSQFLPRV